MIAAVIQFGLNVYYRIAGNNAVGHSFLDTGTYRRDIFTGDRAAFDAVDELKAFTLLVLAKADPDVAVLAAAAALADEFTFLLEDIDGVEGAVAVADQIQEVLNLPFDLHGHEVYTTASIGIALSTAGYERPEDMLRDADTAMYRAKALGKARHAVFERTMHTSTVALLQSESDLRRAIERHDFEV